MRFLRVARLDDTDEFVYEPAAAVGELAVPGTFTFTFSDDDPDSYRGKRLQAFRTGFLGTGSFGWATVVVVSEISEAEYKGVVETLARHFVAVYGAPSLDEALPLAREEAQYAAGLCEHEVNTLLTLERRLEDDGIHETFKVIRPQADWEGQGREVRIWDLVPDDGKS